MSLRALPSPRNWSVIPIKNASREMAWTGLRLGVKPRSEPPSVSPSRRAADIGLEWSQSHAATASVSCCASGSKHWGFHRQQEQPASPHAALREEAAARAARQRQSEGAPAQSLGEGGRAAAARAPRGDARPGARRRSDDDDDPLARRTKTESRPPTHRTDAPKGTGGSDREERSRARQCQINQCASMACGSRSFPRRRPRPTPSTSRRAGKKYRIANGRINGGN